MPELSAAEFENRLQACSPEPIGATAVAALHTHYRLLLRWNRQTSLVGPGTIDDAVETHYGESLGALPLIDVSAGKTLVDIGSGAGFPGFVLAAARPGMRAVLLEARERKWSFLKAIALETAVPIECVMGTLDRSLPKGFPPRVDYVTLRALKLSPRAWQTLLHSLTEKARVLIWAGREEPPLPAALRITRSLSLPGSHSKRILELESSSG